MNLRLASELQTDSIVDGPGLRAVIWTQGCSHNCKGCHNPQTHSFTDGFEYSVEELCNDISKLKYHAGITFSGGDPMFQPEACALVATYAKSLGLNVWCYTGFTYEELLKLSEKNKIYLKFLENIDILVDGRFVLEKRNLDLLFRGSENQRLIDVKETMKTGEVTLLNEYEYNEEKTFEKDKLYI
ncbi:MAG: anaerobic ribonucleoside-triphosphate reductase activating protein [Tenericutes bacterium]|nr:anaerobic ribonucleoside-triphosphate reductase activating protein [Mycoplasmatota bacterium]